MSDETTIIRRGGGWAIGGALLTTMAGREHAEPQQIASGQPTVFTQQKQQQLPTALQQQQLQQGVPYGA